MEKYFVTQITKTKDSDIYAIATAVKDDINDAKMLYHQILGGVYAIKMDDQMEHAIVMITNAYGNNIELEVIMPEPVIETVEETEGE